MNQNSLTSSITIIRLAASRTLGKLTVSGKSVRRGGLHIMDDRRTRLRHLFIRGGVLFHQDEFSLTVTNIRDVLVLMAPSRHLPFPLETPRYHPKLIKWAQGET